MRVIYLDETGHSSEQPVAAVAGIILNPDKEWKALATEIDILKDQVPTEFREGFIFHAVDLFHGGKYRERWSREDRWSLLESLLALPRKLKVPLVVGASQKPPKENRAGPHADSIIIHSMAYMLSLKAADIFMINEAPDEVAMVIAEERKEACKALRGAHNLAVDRKLVEQWLPEVAFLFPIYRVKAPPAFASKEEEILLQMADACAWIFQRYIRGADHSERFVAAVFGEFAYPINLGKMRTGCELLLFSLDSWIRVSTALVLGRFGRTVFRNLTSNLRWARGDCAKMYFPTARKFGEQSCRSRRAPSSVFSGPRECARDTSARREWTAKPTRAVVVTPRPISVLSTARFTAMACCPTSAARHAATQRSPTRASKHISSQRQLSPVADMPPHWPGAAMCQEATSHSFWFLLRPGPEK